MSKKAKIAFLCAFMVLVATFAVQVMTGIWLNVNTVLLGVAGGLVTVGLLVDYKMYWEFFTMKTTKHGMNMGATILFTLVLLVCANYMANAHNKSWDLTQEKSNSLSDQTVTLLKSLKEDVSIKVFTKGPTAAEEKQKIKQSLNMFLDASNHVRVQYINPYVDNSLAIQYLNDLPDRETGNAFVFVENGARKVRAESPFDEGAITSTLIKATREGEAKIYFIKGHGEKDIDADGDQGLKDFARSLGESSFKVESLNLVDRKEIPKDATAVAIIGPSVSYLDAELKWLRDYVEKGGKLLMALDPGQHNNMAGFVQSLGVDFANNYVVTLTPIVGGGPAMVLGRTFDGGSDITKSFVNGGSFALFYLASEVKASPTKDAGVNVRELVKSDKFSFTVDDLRAQIHKKPETNPVTIAVEASGKTSDNKSGQPFTAVIFGDSDFLANHSLMVGVNRDLGLNAIAALANQKDLLSIRPKMPKGTMVVLSSVARLGVVICGLALPILLLLTSAVVWFRRRGA